MDKDDLELDELNYLLKTVMMDINEERSIKAMLGDKYKPVINLGKLADKLDRMKMRKAPT